MPSGNSTGSSGISSGDRNLRSNQKDGLNDMTMSNINYIIKQVSTQVSANISADISKRFDEVENRLKTFNIAITENKSSIIKIDHRVDSLEQYTKRCNLRIYGLKRQNSENTNQIISNFICDKLKINITEIDLEHSYRINNSVLLVKFKMHEMKQKIYNSKAKLKHTDYIIREDLTIFRHNAVKAAVAKFGAKNVWTIDGKIRWKINNAVVKPTIHELEKIIEETPINNAE